MCHQHMRRKSPGLVTVSWCLGLDPALVFAGQESRALTYDVQHNAHVVEALADVTRVRVATIAKQSLRRTPGAWVGLLVHDVLGNTGPGEVPDLDGRAGPVHSVYCSNWSEIEALNEKSHIRV